MTDYKRCHVCRKLLEEDDFIINPLVCDRCTTKRMDLAYECPVCGMGWVSWLNAERCCLGEEEAESN